MRRFLYLLFVLFIIQSCTQPDEITAITFNIRYDNKGDGINQWDNRKEKVVALIKKYDPEILGIQEGLNHQVDYLLENLDEYSFCGIGRDDGKTKGEYAAIFYKKDQFELTECQSYWLSETPEIPSTGWDASMNRIATLGLLKNKKSGKLLVAINTHYDHIGEVARLNSSRLINKKVSDNKDYPIILMGDFNAHPESDPYLELAENPELNDTYTKKEGVEDGTFAGGFSISNRGENRIDHIFINNKVELKKYLIIEDNDGTYYPSDHLPVMVRVSVH